MGSALGVVFPLVKAVENEMERKATSSKVDVDGRNLEMRRARWTQMSAVRGLRLGSTGYVHERPMGGAKKQLTMRGSAPLSSHFFHPSWYSCPAWGVPYSLIVAAAEAKIRASAAGEA